jgi:hypothetical protein
MSVEAAVALGVGLFSLAGALIVVGIRVGSMQKSIESLDRDVAALAGMAVSVGQLSTEFHAASELIAAHMSSDGHQWALLKLERLQTLFDALKDEVNKLEKRETV